MSENPDSTESFVPSQIVGGEEELLRSITSLQAQGNRSLEKQQFLEAISIYEQCILEFPDVISNYWYLGLSWLLHGDSFQAQTIGFSAFTQFNLDLEAPEITEFVNFLKGHAENYLSSQYPQFAQQIYEAILDWCETDIEIYDNLGQALALQGDLETAIEVWQKGIELQPNHCSAYLNQAILYQKLEQFEQAIQCYQEVIQRSPDYLSYYQLGLCLTQMKHWESAIDAFQNSIQLQPNYAPAYSDLGINLIIKGLLESGIYALNQGIQKQPQFYQALIQKIHNQTLFTPNINSRAIQFLKLLSFPLKIPIDLYIYLGQILSNFDQNSALMVLRKAQEIDPHNFEIYLSFGDIFYEHKQDYLEALQCYLAANLSGSLSGINTIGKLGSRLSLEDRKARYHLKVGQCWLKLEHFSKAIIHFKKAIHYHPNLAEGYYGLAQAFFNTGEIQEAIYYLKQSLKENSESALYLGYLGFLLVYNHQTEQGLLYFKKALEKESSMAVLVDSLLNHLFQTGKLNPNLNLSEVQAVNPPTQFDELTKDWLKLNSLNQLNYQQIYSETVVALKPPKSLDHSIHFSFRFGQKIQLPSAFVVQLSQGRFWLSSDQTQSAILTSEQHFLGDLSPEFPLLSPGHPEKHPRYHSILSVQKLPPIHQIQGTVAVLAGLSNSVYFHWMLDVLPRIELLIKSNINWDNIDYFIVDNRCHFQQETLELLGIPENQQINIHNLHHVQATELIVPSFPGCVAWMPKWTCDFLKQQFLIPDLISNSPNFKRIYISRNSAKSRRVLNEDELLTILKPFGVESVQLESMSVVEQAALFSQAELIIAPHGSGLTNLVFCQPGTKVIELFSPNYVYHCYWWISNLVELDYYYYIGETLPGYYLHRFTYPRNFSEDIWIDIQPFLTLLKTVEIS
ncbi:glycosyltransferase 61 family protein [Planktothrix sp. FACHB-1365]|uniref:glycosyltransferase 61 family protein n=1 Tax=Planktothrix sp. FACHB-1365 TaxID=2692855 RepID=UPI00168854B4|nr:glycosyltransferase 61 family protein [Planktothrix sp. FACHB-1365]MBD2483561.1 DUF563 domain-containing protein [Planktothrix sp. FACHB-1365]